MTKFILIMILIGLIIYSLLVTSAFKKKGTADDLVRDWKEMSDYSN